MKRYTNDECKKFSFRIEPFFTVYVSEKSISASHQTPSESDDFLCTTTVTKGFFFVGFFTFLHQAHPLAVILSVPK